MSGYTPVFDTVFSGSLYGRYPDTAAWLFMLALADWQGHIDRTPEYIAGVTGMPLDDLKGCIERFTSPDPYSRSQAEEGRKLVLIDPNRSWGWRVVNISLYRKKASERNRTESGQNAEKQSAYRERKRYAALRGVTTGDGTHTHTQTHTQTDISLPTGEGRVTAPKARKVCPEDWKPSDSLLKKIQTEEIGKHLARGGTSVELELERMRSCTFGTARQDWDKVAWNWLLTECKKIKQKEAMYGAARQARR